MIQHYFNISLIFSEFYCILKENHKKNKFKRFIFLICIVSYSNFCFLSCLQLQRLYPLCVQIDFSLITTDLFQSLLQAQVRDDILQEKMGTIFKMRQQRNTLEKLQQGDHLILQEKCHNIQNHDKPTHTEPRGNRSHPMDLFQDLVFEGGYGPEVYVAWTASIDSWFWHHRIPAPERLPLVINQLRGEAATWWEEEEEE